MTKIEEALKKELSKEKPSRRLVADLFAELLGLECSNFMAAKRESAATKYVNDGILAGKQTEDV